MDDKKPSDNNNDSDTGENFDLNFDKNFESDENIVEHNNDIDMQYQPEESQPVEPQPEEELELDDSFFVKNSETVLPTDITTEKQKPSINSYVTTTPPHKKIIPEVTDNKPPIESSDFTSKQQSSVKKSQDQANELNVDLEDEFLELDFSEGGSNDNFDDLEDLFEEESKEININDNDDFEVLSNSSELKSKDIKTQIKFAREQANRKTQPPTDNQPDLSEVKPKEHQSFEENELQLSSEDLGFDPDELPATPSVKLPPLPPGMDEILPETTVIPNKPDSPINPDKQDIKGFDDKRVSFNLESTEDKKRFPPLEPKQKILLGALLGVIILAGAYFLIFKKSNKNNNVVKTINNQLAKKTEKKQPKTKPEVIQSKLNKPKTNPPVTTDKNTTSDKTQQTPETKAIKPEVSAAEKRADILKNLNNKKTPEQLLYEKALESNSMELYREYINKYPHGEYRGQVITAINKLNRTDQSIEIKNNIQKEILKSKKRNLRSQYKIFTNEEYNQISPTSIFKSRQVERKQIKNDSVIIDYETGLLWHLWPNPMNFSQIPMFQARVYARYSGWRLPTVDEALSVPVTLIKTLNINKLKQAKVWTGDRRNNKKILVDIKSKRLSAGDSKQTYYLLVCKKL